MKRKITRPETKKKKKFTDCETNDTDFINYVQLQQQQQQQPVDIRLS